MAKKKLNLKELTDDELREKLRDDSSQYLRMKFNHAVSHIENPMRIRTMRRDVARVKTEIKKREMTAANSK